MGKLQRFSSVRLIQICALLILTVFCLTVFVPGCRDEVSESALPDLPSAMNGVMTGYHSVISVRYDERRAVYKVDQQEFSDIDKVVKKIVIEAEAFGEADPSIEFILPKTFPASTFADLCQKTQHVIANRGRHRIMVFSGEAGEAPRAGGKECMYSISEEL